MNHQSIISERYYSIWNYLFTVVPIYIYEKIENKYEFVKSTKRNILH